MAWDQAIIRHLPLLAAGSAGGGCWRRWGAMQQQSKRCSGNAGACLLLLLDAHLLERLAGALRHACTRLSTPRLSPGVNSGKPLRNSTHSAAGPDMAAEAGSAEPVFRPQLPAAWLARGFRPVDPLNLTSEPLIPLMIR